MYNCAVQGPQAAAERHRRACAGSTPTPRSRSSSSPAAAARSRTCCPSPTRAWCGRSPPPAPRWSPPSGHETDTTLVDHVADVRAATPTDAAHRIVPEIGEQRRLVDGLRSRARHLLTGRLEQQERWLESVRTRPVLASPDRLLHGAGRRRLRAAHPRPAHGRPPRRGRRARPRARPGPGGRAVPRRDAASGATPSSSGPTARWSATPPRSADGERLRVRVAGGRLPVRVDRTADREDRSNREQRRADRRADDHLRAGPRGARRRRPPARGRRPDAGGVAGAVGARRGAGRRCASTGWTAPASAWPRPRPPTTGTGRRCDRGGQPSTGRTAAATSRSSSSVADPVTTRTTPPSSAGQGRLAALGGQPGPRLAVDVDRALLGRAVEHRAHRGGPASSLTMKPANSSDGRQVADLRVTGSPSPATRRRCARWSAGSPRQVGRREHRVAGPRGGQLHGGRRVDRRARARRRSAGTSSTPRCSRQITHQRQQRPQHVRRVHPVRALDGRRRRRRGRLAAVPVASGARLRVAGSSGRLRSCT